VLVIKFDYLTRLTGTHTKERPSTGDRVNLARELTRAVDSDKSLSGPEGTHNLELAGDDHKKWYSDVSLFVEHFTSL
jgi:hypothetical protein